MVSPKFSSCRDNEKPRKRQNYENPEIMSAEILRCAVGKKSKRVRDELAREEPLEIRVRGESVNPDAAITNATVGFHAVYFVLDSLSLAADLRYQWFLSTPTF